MAQQGCESCQKWREHYSQEHMDVHRTRFFKLMTGDFARCVSIPHKFQNSLKGKISEGFNLKAPSSKTWRVGLTKDADELLFASGWSDFARAHELQENDLLIFTLSGNDSLDVMIFDSSGCEKVSSFFIGKRDPCMPNHFNNMDGQQAEHCILSDSDDTSTPLRFSESAHKASALKKITGKPKPWKEPEAPESCNYRIRHAGSKYYSRSANILTEDERKEIFGLASIQPGNPAYVTILHKSHMRHRNNLLIFHSGFAADHLEMKSHDILLLMPNRKEKWYVTYYHGNSTRGFNCRRWVKFVSENRLHEGDVCVFELMKGARRKTMVVHVVRKVNGRFVLVC